MNRADLESLSKVQLIELVLGLAQQVAELKARLELPAKTPENSSVPPSQGRKPSVGGKRKRRRKGRPGVARALDPNPTAAREVRAGCCPHFRGDVAAAQAPCESYDHIEVPPWPFSQPDAGAQATGSTR
jgi:transposase